MRRLLLCIVAAFSFPYLSFSCFWDYDTIEMERQQFPDVIELISGKFLRHSQTYHLWRIKERQRKLKTFPDSLALYDDLAVSYSKTGQDSLAIQVILKKDSLTPHLYETHANLGTFYLHHGSLRQGIKAIEKAIAINPDAHFGREVYQKLLAEYVLQHSDGNEVLLPMNIERPRCPDCPPDPIRQQNFYRFIVQQNKTDTSITPQRALKGIMGMMKFGNHDSPILLEALGDLLIDNGKQGAARQLAARAYLKASWQTTGKASKAYETKAASVLNLQLLNSRAYISLENLSTMLKKECEEGNKFYREIEENEIRWITEGKNPEAEFAVQYYRQPVLSSGVTITQKGNPDKARMRVRMEQNPSSVRFGIEKSSASSSYLVDSLFSLQHDSNKQTDIPMDESQSTAADLVTVEVSVFEQVLTFGIGLLALAMLYFGARWILKATKTVLPKEGEDDENEGA